MRRGNRRRSLPKNKYEVPLTKTIVERIVRDLAGRA